MPLIDVPAEVQLKRLQPLATPAVVKPEAIIVGPGDRTGPEVGETATDGEAEAPTDEAGVADTPGAVSWSSSNSPRPERSGPRHRKRPPKQTRQPIQTRRPIQTPPDPPA